MCSNRDLLILAIPSPANRVTMRYRPLSTSYSLHDKRASLCTAVSTLRSTILSGSFCCRSSLCRRNATPAPFAETGSRCIEREKGKIRRAPHPLYRACTPSRAGTTQYGTCPSCGSSDARVVSGSRRGR